MNHGKAGVVSELAMARAQRNTVLIIDDLFSSRLLLAEIVRQIDGKLNLELFDTPSRALEYARNNRVDMVLTDYKLPEFDGVQLVRQIRALPHCVDVPIVVITVVDDRRVRYEALEAGATDFLIKPLDEHETRARCANLLDLRRHKIVLSDQARVLQYQVDKSVAEIHERELETLSKLAKAGEFRDRTTGNHLTRMARYSALIGTNIGLGAGDGTRARSRRADARHRQDRHSRCGSAQEGPLTAEEDAVMKTHPRIGYDILKGSPSKYLSMGAIIALGHHEKYDGSGYPNGLHGEDIPIVARIVAVADVFDALVSERPYKHAWSRRGRFCLPRRRKRASTSIRAASMLSWAVPTRCARSKRRTPTSDRRLAKRWVAHDCAPSRLCDRSVIAKPVAPTPSRSNPRSA